MLVGNAAVGDTDTGDDPRQQRHQHRLYRGEGRDSQQKLREGAGAHGERASLVSASMMIRSFFTYAIFGRTFGLIPHL